jgi:hypothetical protein
MDKRKVLAVAIASCAMLLGLASPAVAAPKPSPGTATSSQAELGSQQTSKNGVSPAATLGGNPYGCYGQTDYPHWSSDYASVHARTKCSVALPELYVETDLYRSRWYGWQYLTWDQSQTSWLTTSYDATPHWYCKGVGTYTYEGDSYHEVNGGGTTYYAYTYNDGRFSC